MRAKKKLSFFDRLILWLTWMLSVALLISYLSPITDPRKYWIIAFFGLAYPLLLSGNLLMLLYWTLRQCRYLFIPVICILCGLGMLNKNIGLHKSKEVTPGTGIIRMMTYNVHNFKKFGSKKDISTKHEILSIVAGQHPDVVGFQEYYSHGSGQYDMVDSIKKIMHSDNYYVEVFDRNLTDIIGMAIFSKYPILNKGLIKLSNENGSGNQCIFIDIKKDGRMLRIYSVHLQSIQFMPVDYRYMDTISKGGPDLHGTLRLGGKLRRAFLKRAEQVMKVKDHAAQCPYPYIISGDFNDTPASFAVNQMAKGLKNAFSEKGFGLGRTYNGDFPNYQIDYIMATQQFNVLSYNIIEKKLSDHYPVVCDLMLK